MSVENWASQVGRQFAAQRHFTGDLLVRSATRDPAKTALVYNRRRQSYKQLDSGVNRVANAMLERGINKGDRVAVVSRNSDAFVALNFAARRIGAILVPINFMLNALEVAFILGHSGACALIVEDALVETAEQALRSLPIKPSVFAVISDDSGVGDQRWEHFNSWLQNPNDSHPEIYVADDDPTQIMYTSGTESRPKGATLSWAGLVAQYVSCIIDGQMAPTDIELHALPLYHCAQLHCFLVPGLYLGQTNILLRSADAATILATIEEERVTKIFCPPTVWISLLRHPDFPRRDMSSLRKGYYGASIMPMEVIRELDERLPGIHLYNFYGQTEMSPLATVLSPGDQIRKLGAAGKPVINVETRIVDTQDQVVAAGTVGEIVHRSPHVMLGYWNDPEMTAQVFSNGWFHSGDLGVMDEEGFLTVVDRKKDMIKTGGENVASREVEEAIYEHPAVAEVAVIGLPHPVWIEGVVAVVVLRVGRTVTEEVLGHHCRERLAGFKCPKKIIFVVDVPRNASGKVLKRELRSRFEDALKTSSADQRPRAL